MIDEHHLVRAQNFDLDVTVSPPVQRKLPVAATFHEGLQLARQPIEEDSERDGHYQY